MSTIYPEIKSILDKCGVSADHVASIVIEPMSVIIKRHALKDGKPYSEDNKVVMRPDLLVHIETRDIESRGPTKEDRERIIEFLDKKIIGNIHDNPELIAPDPDCQEGVCPL